MSLPLLFDEIGLMFHILIKEREMNTDQMFDVPVQDTLWRHATAWVSNKKALRPYEFEEIVKTYAQPGGARGSIACYRAGGGSGQVALTSGNIPPVPITHPTMILWGEADPIAPPAWADRLGETFSHLLGVQFLPEIGHFVPFEAPEAVVEAIRTVL